jgi:hypothetical protein
LRLVVERRPLDTATEAALKADGRAGARSILAAIARRRCENRSEGQRLRKMLSGFFFTDNVLGSLVLAQTEEGRVSHFSGRRPFRELDFCHQLRLHPGGHRLVLDPLLEWGAVGAQRRCIDDPQTTAAHARYIKPRRLQPLTEAADLSRTRAQHGRPA